LNGFQIIPTTGFEQDLARLETFVVERELRSGFPDETAPERFRQAVLRGLDILAFAPHTCRRCEAAPRWRELVVLQGGSGVVVLFAVRGAEVLLLAARAQREEDFR